MKEFGAAFSLVGCACCSTILELNGRTLIAAVILIMGLFACAMLSGERKEK